MKACKIVSFKERNETELNRPTAVIWGSRLRLLTNVTPRVLAEGTTYSQLKSKKLAQLDYRRVQPIIKISVLSELS